MIVFFFLLFFSVCESKTLLKQTTQEYREYSCNGHIFVHEFNITNGTIQEKWYVDKKEINSDTYQQQLLHDEMAEYQKQEEQERLLIEEKKKFATEARKTIEKRLFHLSLESIMNFVDKIHEYELEPYLQCSPDTIPSLSDYYTLCNTTLPRLERQVRDDPDTTLNGQLVMQLEDYNDRLERLYQNTLRYVIENATDTKLLKKLLANL